MSRKCSITGKKAMSGNNVSHSKRRTRRKFKVNVSKKKFFSETLGVNVYLNLAVSTVRTVVNKYNNSIDQYILSVKANKLDDKALSLRTRIRRKIRKSA